MRQPGGLGLNDRDVGPGIGPDTRGRDFAPVVEPNPHPARAADDMVICEQKPIGGDQKARPRACGVAGSPSAETARRFTTAGPSFSATVTITRE